MSTERLIKLKRITKEYKTLNNSIIALNNISLNIFEGEFIAIMGASGSGKSTLLNIIGLLDNYDTGEYLLNSKQTHNLSDNEAAALRNKALGFIFQSFNLLPQRNALENVSLPLYYQGVSYKERNERALYILNKMGLADWSNHLPTELSGGQQQRVAIARALVTNPKVILADEPTGALDSETSQEIMDLLSEINDKGKTVIIVTHEHEIAARTKRKITLNDGEIVSDKTQISIPIQDEKLIFEESRTV